MAEKNIFNNEIFFPTNKLAKIYLASNNNIWIEMILSHLTIKEESHASNLCDTILFIIYVRG